MEITVFLSYWFPGPNLVCFFLVTHLRALRHSLAIPETKQEGLNSLFLWREVALH